MVGIRGVSARLLDVGGIYFDEYENRLHSGHTVSCYVESESGKPFNIEVDNCVDTRDYINADFLTFRILVDGRYVDSQVCGGGSSELIAGVPCSSDVQRRFVFRDLRSLDDPRTFRQDWRDWDRFGLIEVQAHRVWAEEFTSPTISRSLEKTHYVHRRSTKAGTHFTSFGEELTQSQPRLSVTYVDPLDMPFATLRIYYRPKAFLQARNVIRLPLFPHYMPYRQHIKQEAAETSMPTHPFYLYSRL